MTMFLCHLCLTAKAEDNQTVYESCLNSMCCETELGLMLSNRNIDIASLWRRSLGLLEDPEFSREKPHGRRDKPGAG
ncbi:hypothetical protein DL98DRAFT_508269 [Cadophora sp. DSE1049]|nr:hypothetical protein DL98DRAFT_508269 [Cadophora sp. DSE1049]